MVLDVVDMIDRLPSVESVGIVVREREREEGKVGDRKWKEDLRPKTRLIPRAGSIL